MALRLGSSFTGVRAKLLGALASVAVLTTLLTGSFALRYSYGALKEQKQQDELAIARNIAVQVEEVLGKARQTIEALAEHPIFASMDAARQREALTLVTRVTELIDGIAAVDLSGRVLAMDGAEPATAGLLPRDIGRYLVAGVRRGRGAHLSEVFWNSAGEPLVAINVPIKAGAETRGVLSGLIALRNHSLGGLEDIRIGKSGYAYLVDGEGDVLVHPQRRKVMENLRAHPPVRALLSRGEGVIEFINQEGVAVLAAFAPVQGAGWGVIVRQPTSESYANAVHILYVLSAVFLLSLIAALALGLHLARRISKPLTELVRGVQRVSEGDLSARLRTAGDDEIARLGTAFNEMAGRLQERMAEIAKAHARVIETERRLGRSERLAAIGQLAAGLAHEINNPLNVMSGFCELLLSKTPEEDSRRAQLEEIARECGRCQRLVEDLLDYAKPKEPRRAPVRLRELIGETANLVSARTRAQGVELQLDADPKLPPLLADADQLKQLLLNLFLNACDAMPDGGSLRVVAAVEHGDAVVRVTDTGPGIPPQQLKSVFDPFFTTKKEGTGLGLSVCQAIAESHGGSLEARSDDLGASFILRIPALEVPHAAVA